MNQVKGNVIGNRFINFFIEDNYKKSIKGEGNNIDYVVTMTPVRGGIKRQQVNSLMYREQNKWAAVWI